DGSVRGFPTATLFERDNPSEELALSNEGEIRRDLLQVVQPDANSSASLDDQLSLTLALKGLEIDAPKFLKVENEESGGWTYLAPGSTDITVTGKFLGSAIFDGVVWEPKEVNKNDLQLVFPQLPESEQPNKDSKEFGRFSDSSSNEGFLGYSVSDLLANDGQDKAPIRV